MHRVAVTEMQDPHLVLLNIILLASAQLSSPSRSHKSHRFKPLLIFILSAEVRTREW